MLGRRKISVVKSKTELGLEIDDGVTELEGGGGLGGGIDDPLDFLDCGLWTDGGLDSRKFEAEKLFDEINDIPEHAAWKKHYTREFHIDTILLFIIIKLNILIYL